MKDDCNLIRFIDEKNDENFQSLIRGHLYLEALLGEIITRCFKHPDALERNASMFFNKVKLVRAIGRLSESEEDLLLAVNALRNKLAHNLDFALGLEAVFALLPKAKAASIDFSDDGIFERRHAEDCYGICGIVNEVISNTFSHLLWQNEDLFTKDDIGRLLG